MGEPRRTIKWISAAFSLHIQRKAAKAGAMNVLTRVSWLMTNAPYMLNVDCDMFVNRPSIILDAMCMLLGSKIQNENAFVQCPQVFYDGLKDVPFGNQMVVMWKYQGQGISAIQGPFYSGTGCVHGRKVIYGLTPSAVNIGDENPKIMFNGKPATEELPDIFGKEFTNSAADALEGKANASDMLSETIQAAYQVAGVGYEYGTQWGKKVGCTYGSTTEDVLTGLTIHNKGWKSILYAPDPPAFLGCAPTGGPASMTQQKRWATGLLEILLSKYCPLFDTFFANLQFRQCLAYFWILSWGIRSVPELCYAALPALLRLQPPARDGVGSGSLEIVFSVLLVACLWPFMKGLFASGKYGIPLSIIFKSSGLALLFYTICRY